MAFVAVATLLVALGLAILLAPFLRTPRIDGGMTPRGTSLSVLRDQLFELERDHNAGLIDAAQLEQSRADVERMAAEELAAAVDARPAPVTSGSIRTAMILALALPAFALAWYGTRGGWRGGADFSTPAMSGGSAATEMSAAAPHEDIAGITAKLEARLRDDPNSAEGWFLLARTYHSAQRYEDAVAAYERARRLLPGDPDLLADYADTLAMLQGRRLAGKPADLVREALAAKPDHVKSLLLAGSAAFEAADFRAAAGFWERATRVTQPGTEFGDTARGALADARRRIGEADIAGAPSTAGTPAAGVSPGTERGAAAGAAVARGNSASSTIEGLVKLAPDIAGKAGRDDTVFVIARAVSGPPMPLAVKRFRVSDLPAKFSMSDADAMVPELTISKVGDIVMVARVSRRGEPKASSGDLEGITAAMKPPQRNVEIQINRVLP